METRKSARRSGDYGRARTSASRRTATIVTDCDLFLALACAALVLAFGGCLVHWAVAA